MAQILCKECGAENDSNTRFCVRCDGYLDWAEDTAVETPEDRHDVPVTAPEDTRPTPSETSDGAARPPQITPSTTTATLGSDTGAQIDIEVRNRSTIVDAFRVDMIAPPRWLTLNRAEVRVLPGETGLLAAAFGIQPGTHVVAQTVNVVIRVSSQRDTDQYVDANMSLTIPPAGPPVSIKVQPSVVRLVDQTEGRAQILLDNTESNYPRTITLTGADDQAALGFLFSPPRLEIGPGRVGEAEMQFGAPEIAEGTNETRTALITAREGENTTTVNLTVNQQRSAVLPLQTRLEPSVVRVTDRRDAQLNLIIDNRNGRQDRRIDLHGRDPEGVIQFAFAQPTVVVPAGQVSTVRMAVSAAQPPHEREIQRQFIVVASEATRDTEAAGTLVQFTSPRQKSRWAQILTAAIVLSAAALAAVLWFVLGAKPETTTATNTWTPPVDTTTTPVTTTPITTPSSNTLPDAFALPPDTSGRVYIRTVSKRTRCVISEDEVKCEAKFTNSPIVDGSRANQVIAKADGNIPGDGHWVSGSFGGIPVIDITYDTYRAVGWTILAEKTGTRFTNDRTGHGMRVSVDKVEFF